MSKFVASVLLLPFSAHYRVPLDRVLPIFVHLWLEPFLDLGFGFEFLLYRSKLTLEPLLCPHNLALQVETTALLRIVGVEQPLVPLEDFCRIGLAVGRRLDVEDSASLIERHARREGSASGWRSIARLDLRTLVGRRSLGLLVGGDEGATENTGACEEGRDDEFVRLKP